MTQSRTKTSPQALAAHRRVASNLRTTIWLHIALSVLCAVLLVIALKQEWHWLIRVTFALGLGSALVGMLADINALSDRKKVIAKIESAREEKTA